MTFDEFWAAEIKANSGIPVGADYRVWAKAGWDAATKVDPMTFDDYLKTRAICLTVGDVGKLEEAVIRYMRQAWDESAQQAKERHATICEEEADSFQDNHNMQAMSGADRCAIRIRSS